jgi:hypothetical protein
MVSTNKKDMKLPKEIDNRLSIAEQELLYELARNVSCQQVVVEMTNRTSESTEALVRGARSSGARVFNLTLYSKNQYIKKAAHGDSDTRLRDGTCETERKNEMTIPIGSAYDLTRGWKESVGLLVVVGHQHYDEIRKAFLCWQGHLSPEVAVVIHNCHEFGPARAIKELASDGGNFLLGQSVENLVVLIRDRCQHYWVISSDDVGSCRHCGRKRNFKRLGREENSLEFRKITMYRITR